MRKAFLLFIFCVFIIPALAQTGGSSVFPYISLAPSSRVAGLGGLVTSIKDDDVSLFTQNPSLLNADMNNKISLTYQPFADKISSDFLSYSHTFGKDWCTGISLQFINYGKFPETDDLGNNIGEFYANDLALTAGVSRPLTDRITYGANVKFLYSVLSSYSSDAIALDVGGTYSDTANGFTVSAVISNFGTQLKAYTPGDMEKLPVDLQVGVSKRLKHTPFLFNIGLHHLQQFNIRYNDTSVVSSNSLSVDTVATGANAKHYIADKILRHVIVGVELIIGHNLRIQVGYNDLRRQELAFDAAKGLAGFSFGAQIKISYFNIGYAHSFYNTAGGYNALSLGLNMNDFVGKKKM